MITKAKTLIHFFMFTEDLETLCGEYQMYQVYGYAMDSPYEIDENDNMCRKCVIESNKLKRHMKKRHIDMDNGFTACGRKWDEDADEFYDQELCKACQKKTNMTSISRFHGKHIVI